jgi:hypothetical protein
MILNNFIDNPIINYLLKLCIYGQMPFFMWLYESNKEFEDFKYINSIDFDLIILYVLNIIPVIIYVYKIHFHYYTTQLFILYNYMILFCYVLFRLYLRYSIKDALSMSFLIVFLNSYYWEMVLHISAAHYNLYELINPRETIRLIIVPFLLANYSFNKSKSLRMLRIGVIISGIIAYLRLKTFRIEGIRVITFYMPVFGNIGKFIYFINRVVCLIILMIIMVYYSYPKKEKSKWFH